MQLRQAAAASRGAEAVPAPLVLEVDTEEVLSCLGDTVLRTVQVCSRTVQETAQALLDRRALQAGGAVPATGDPFEGTNTTVYFCTTVYRRGWQLRLTLGLNILCMLEAVKSVKWVILFCSREPADLEDARWAKQYCERAGVDEKLVCIRVPADVGLTSWTSSKAKNAVHRAACTAADLQGQTGPGQKVFLLNLDCDNFLTGGFVERLRQALLALVPSQDAVQLSSNDPGTTGRVGLFAGLFCSLGGYDEAFRPAGYQDVDVIRRVQSRGRVHTARTPCSGESVPNDLRNKKAARGVAKVSAVTDPQYAGMSWQDMNTWNVERGKDMLRQGFWYRNWHPSDSEAPRQYPDKREGDFDVYRRYKSILEQIGFASTPDIPAEAVEAVPPAGAAASSAASRAWEPVKTPENMFLCLV